MNRIVDVSMLWLVFIAVVLLCKCYCVCNHWGIRSYFAAWFYCCPSHFQMASSTPIGAGYWYRRWQIFEWIIRWLHLLHRAFIVGITLGMATSSYSTNCAIILASPIYASRPELVRSLSQATHSESVCTIPWVPTLAFGGWLPICSPHLSVV